jgi:hypothetical protein
MKSGVSASLGLLLSCLSPSLLSLRPATAVAIAKLLSMLSAMLVTDNAAW